MCRHGVTCPFPGWGWHAPSLATPCHCLAVADPQPHSPPPPPLRSCWTEADCSAPAAAADAYVFEKLVALFDGNRAGLGWEELVDLAQHAALGDQFVLRWAGCMLSRFELARLVQHAALGAPLDQLMLKWVSRAPFCSARLLGAAW